MNGKIPKPDFDSQNGKADADPNDGVETNPESSVQHADRIDLAIPKMKPRKFRQPF